MVPDDAIATVGGLFKVNINVIIHIIALKVPFDSRYCNTNMHVSVECSPFKGSRLTEPCFV